MFTAFALECPGHFLNDTRGPQAERIQLGVKLRTGPYNRYCPGVAQMKNGLGAKKDLLGRALPGIERYGA